MQGNAFQQDAFQPNGGESAGAPGFVSPLLFLIGGLGAAPAGTTRGFFSPLVFVIGGLGSDGAVTPDVQLPSLLMPPMMAGGWR